MSRRSSRWPFPFVGAELGDPEAARCGVELVELDDRAALVTPGVVSCGNDEDVARVREDLRSVVHSDLHRSLDHVADVRVAASVRTHLLRELPAGRIVRALDLDVAEVDDVDLDAALLHLLVRLIECPTRGLAHGCHRSLPSSLSLRATLLHPLQAVSPARAGGQAGYGCSPGFDLGALTFEQGVALPRIDAGLKAGVFDMAGLAAGFNKVDHNDDDLICFKDVGALSGDVGIWVYSYNIVDNNASSPGS